MGDAQARGCVRAGDGAALHPLHLKSTPASPCRARSVTTGRRGRHRGPRCGRGCALPPQLLRVLHPTQVSVRRIHHDKLRSLGLIPGASALLIDHAAVVHRHAVGRRGAHHRADDRGSHGDSGAHRRGRRDRMIVVVPAAAAATAAFDIDVDVPLGVDVVDAAAADIVGARIRPAVVDLRTLPSACATRCLSAASAAPATLCLSAATPPPPPPPPPRPPPPPPPRPPAASA